MRTICVAIVLAFVIAMMAPAGLAQQSPTAGPYKVLKTAKVGGEGGLGLHLCRSRRPPVVHSAPWRRASRCG